MLTLTMKNIGLIEDANIKLSPFTVIAGKNASGKSFITKSIYSVFSTLNKDASLIFLENLEKELARYLPFLEEEQHFRQFVSKDLPLLKEIYTQANPSVEISKINIGAKLESIVERVSVMREQLEGIPFPRIKLANESLNKVIDLIKDFKKTELEIIESLLIKSFCGNFQSTEVSKLINVNAHSSAMLSLEEDEKIFCSISLNPDNSVDYDIDTRFISDCKTLESILYIESPVYLKLLKFIQENRSNVFSSDELTGVPKYIYDLLESIKQRRIKTDEPILSIEDFAKLSQSINGRLNTKNVGGITYEDNAGNTFPLEQTAMGVINLGIIHLLIENGFIRKGSFIIFDEPETNLHPEWQLTLIEILYLLSQKGVNVIMATHSNTTAKKIESLIQKHTDDAEAFFSVNYFENGKSLISDEQSVEEKMRLILDELTLPYAGVAMGVM